MLELDAALKTLITSKSSSDVIEKTAEERGMSSMLADGVAKIFKGVTTLEEVMRVTKA